ncbi:hypothetical protein NP233_g2031 [Leucocoprinus birnbaumii]|uniref:Uncharacterized protein n=1 Tax=Leucocoprinus birnbaumii TaxID=56174 RepID=A0AAD5YU80_9AGAR|nr:hypothetical protein NP233_g2031 [Leucocoprinus birnbaumii]
MQWQKLTSLYISYWSIQFGDFVRIASQCPNLSECLIRLSYVYAWFDDHNFDPPNHGPLNFTLPMLHNLTIVGTHNDDITVSDLFRRISAPALTHLTWTRSALAGEPWSFTPLSSIEDELLQSLRLFLSQLVTPLEELDLWLDPVSEEALVGILKCVLKLKRLSTGGFVQIGTLPRYGWQWDTSDGYPPNPIPYLFNDTILLGLIPGRMPQIDATYRSNAIQHKLTDVPYDLTCLCPQLEIILYYSLAKFNPKDLLELFRSCTLSCGENGVAHLRYMSIFFPFSARPLGLCETEEFELRTELENLGRETGVWVNIEHASDVADVRGGSDQGETKGAFSEQLLDHWGCFT